MYMLLEFKKKEQKIIRIYFWVFCASNANILKYECDKNCWTLFNNQFQYLLRLKKNRIKIYTSF